MKIYTCSLAHPPISVAPRLPAVRQAVPIRVRTGLAVFHTFRGLCDDREHFALGFGDWRSQEAPLTRLHSECMTGDVLGSHRCDCGEQLAEAMERMSREGGLLLYLRQEGRGIGLYNKLDAYALQDLGYDTFEANRGLDLPEDGRSYEPAAQMLRALGVYRVRLLTNNPDKVDQLELYGTRVAEAVPTNVYLKKDNARYLGAKAEKAGHRLALTLEA